MRTPLALGAIRGPFIAIALALLAACNSSPPPEAFTNVTIVLPARGLPVSQVERSRFGDDCRLQNVVEEAMLGEAIEHGGCMAFHQPNFAVSAEHFEGPAGRLPLLIFRPRTQTGMHRLVIQLVGGPAGDIWPMVLSDWGRYFGTRAAAGTVTIAFGYAGTRTRLVDGIDTLDLAAAELAAYVRLLHHHFPALPVVVVGESMGGYVAARAARDLPGTPMVFLAPPLVSPRQLLARRGPEFERAKQFNRSLVTLSRLERGRVVPVATRMTNQWHMFNTIFADHLDVTFADMLPPDRTRCYALIYGTADEIIGTAEIPAVRRRFPGLRVVTLLGLPHKPEGEGPIAVAEQAVTAAVDAATCAAPGTAV
jgi:pimeloyl-ACP methyl ester carboxylesterase